MGAVLADQTWAILSNLGTEGMVAEDGPRFSGPALPSMLQPRAIRECGFFHWRINVAIMTTC
jgi:hypothetical protein